jgi:hypothetical protein
MDPDQNELSGGETPLAFRMLENLPGFSASFLFAQHRGSNTIMRGGFGDNNRTFGFGDKTFKTPAKQFTIAGKEVNIRSREMSIRGRSFGGPGKLGGFTKEGILQSPSSNAFYGSKTTRARKAAAVGADTKMPFLKGARANHLTTRPAALGRYNSLAMFNAADKTPFYSPFQMAAKMGGSQAAKSSAFRTAVYGSDAALAPETQVFQRGMVSMMTAGRKLDTLERRVGKGSGRAARQLATGQEQVRRLAGMNNPAILQGKSTVQVAAGMRTAPIGMGSNVADRLLAARAAGPTVTMSPMAKALAGGPQVGLTGNLLASAGATEGSRFMQGYFRGALGHSGAGGLMDEAMTGANRAVSHLSTALGGNKTRVATKALDQGVIKTIGIKNTAKALGTKQGAMVLGARAGMMAIPGLNLLATASLVYDLGKMGGEVVKSGINLAKDAVKSMKGSIDKPMFGMGYKDNEVAATSRARGVAAIQNSRLNARSALGSEGAMMASHFG